MSISGYQVPITDDISAKLDEYPVAARNRVLERAIDRALDAHGWPAGERGAMAIAASYWYVTVIDPQPLRVRGHVGPIPDAERAKRVAASWRQTGCIARMGRTPDGPPLTNVLR